MINSSQNQNENNIANIIHTMRTWSLLWNIEELFQEIVNSTAIALNVNRCYLLLIENTGLNIKKEYIEHNAPTHIFLNEIAERVIRNGNPLYAHDLEQTNEYNTQIYCVPLVGNQGVLGALYLVRNNHKLEISSEEKVTLEMLSVQAASFIENAILYHSAITDPLTGLFSHRHFQQECDQLLRRAIRLQSCVSLMIIDLDHFKQLNDQFGHEEGNKCLKHISEILRASFRATDVVARFGGDEFEILLPDASTEKCILIAQALAETIRKEQFPIQISVTIGIATFPDHAIDSQSLFLAADQALYAGKHKGRDCVTVTETNATTITSEKNNLQAKNIHQLISQKAIIPQQKNNLQKVDGLEILRSIANSSSGEVLLAKQIELDRLVALKRPIITQLTEQQSLAFKHEALLTASLSHPGVIPLYTMGKSTDGRVYYTMKPLEGVSLEDVLEKWKKKDPAIVSEYNLYKLTYILLKASETIAYAHNKNTVHLDIHPENIIIGEFGEITLIDWGKGLNLNKDNLTNLHSKTYISGSPIYRAPEQLKSNKIGKFTDVYSLGIILYEILSNKTPYEKNLTKDTIQSIINSHEIEIESDPDFQGVEPILSNACKRALMKDYNARIDIIEFCKILSRFILFETDQYTHSFLDDGEAKNWQAVTYTHQPSVNWSFKDGVFTSFEKNKEFVLFWKPFVNSNFTFTCEAWVTTANREIALICFGRSIYDKKTDVNREERYKGYNFQFGAENNKYTKLSRHGNDIMVNTTHRVELNKKYKIMLSYQDNWLHCYIDDELIFTFRELYPFKGHHIGIYSYNDGAHFKPIEIKYEKTGLQVPAIRLADELFANEKYDIAIERYNDIIETFPDRLDGLEAKLKKGVCYTKLDKPEKARIIFEELQGSILEPFALAEKAMIHLPETFYQIKNKKGDYQEAVSILKELSQKFPGHQANFRILLPCSILNRIEDHNAIECNSSLQKIYESKIELFKIATDTLSPPSQSQIKCLRYLIEHMMHLGLWEQAYSMIELYLSKYKLFILDNTVNLHCLNDLYYSTDMWAQNELIVELNIDIFLACTIVLIKRFSELKTTSIFTNLQDKNWLIVSKATIFKLSLSQKPSLLEITNLSAKSPYDRMQYMKELYPLDIDVFEMLIAQGDNEIIKKEVFSFFESFLTDAKEYSCEAIHLMNYFTAFQSLLAFNFEKMQITLNNFCSYTFNTIYAQKKKILLACFLQSIGFTTDYPQDKLLQDMRLYLYGPRLDLCQLFLKNERFEGSTLWAKKPTYCFYDRVLYCIWATHKGFYKQAKIRLKELIDCELGDSYYQPFLMNLEKRIYNLESTL